MPFTQPSTILFVCHSLPLVRGARRGAVGGESGVTCVAMLSHPEETLWQPRACTVGDGTQAKRAVPTIVFVVVEEREAFHHVHPSIVTHGGHSRHLASGRASQGSCAQSSAAQVTAGRKAHCSDGSLRSGARQRCPHPEKLARDSDLLRSYLARSAHTRVVGGWPQCSNSS